MLIHEYNEHHEKLINNLSKDFDVFLHIDKRSKIRLDNLKSEKVFIFKKYKVYWGSYNQILATLFLFKTSNKNNYDRYIFISGSDIPIKSNSEIKVFFENNKNEYFSFSQLPTSFWNENGGFDRIDYFYSHSLSRGNINLFEKIVNKIQRIINTGIINPLMHLFNLKRRIKNLKYYGGANWMDLTGNCVSQIIEFTNHNKKFVKKFRYTRCADEIFFQTIICNYVENIKIENLCLRYIDWKSGPEFPKILRYEDYHKIKESNCLFARKVNPFVGSKIIYMLYKDIGW